MPEKFTQTDRHYTVIEDPYYIFFCPNVRIRENVCIFFQGSCVELGTDKNTMTQYNSENEYDMDLFIAQLKDSGDF